MRALILVALLAACSPQAEKEDATPAAPAETAGAMALEEFPSWETARAAGVDFRAIGQEPGWMLDVYTADRMRLQWDYGQQSADFQRGEPAYPAEGATRYEARTEDHTLAVTIRRAPCQDAMSGEAYPSTVEVVIDGRTLNGCGRSV